MATLGLFIKALRDVEIIRNSIYSDYEVCGYLDGENREVVIENNSASGEFTLMCKTHTGSKRLNFHTHPQTGYTFNGLPSNTDLESIVKATRQYNSVVSDTIICDKGVFRYGSTSEMVDVLASKGYDKNFILDVPNADFINKQVNLSTKTIEEIVSDFVRLVNRNKFFHFSWKLVDTD